MTLEEMKIEKIELGNKISDLLNKFQEKYHVEIEDVELADMTTRNMTGDTVYQTVSVDIKINL